MSSSGFLRAFARRWLALAVASGMVLPAVAVASPAYAIGDVYTVHSSWSGALPYTTGASVSVAVDITGTTVNAASPAETITYSVPSGMVVGAASPSVLNSALCTPAYSPVVLLSGTGVRFDITPSNVSVATTCTYNISVNTGSSAFSNVPDSVTPGSGVSVSGFSATPITVGTPAPTLSPPTATVTATSPVPANTGTDLVTVTLTNPNDATACGATTPCLSGIAFTMSVMPGSISGLPSTTCGGPVSGGGGAITVALSGGQLGASASCTVTFSALALGPDQRWTYSTGTIWSSAGNNTAGASTTVYWLGVPTVAVSVPVGSTLNPGSGTVPVTVVLSNPNTLGAIPDASFSTNLPSGLTFAGVQSNSCASTSLTAGATTFTQAATSIAASSTCTAVLNVQATSSASVATYSVTATPSSSALGSGVSSTANVSVALPPLSPPTATVTATSPVSGTASDVVTVTLTNPNNSAACASTSPCLSGIGFTMTVPSGSTTSATACGGTVTGSGSASIALTGGQLAASASCTVTITVPAQGNDHQVTFSTGTIASSAGNNSGASTTVNWLSPPGVVMAFAFGDTTLYPGLGVTAIEVTLYNPNSVAAIQDATLSINLPTGLTFARVLGNTCASTPLLAGATTFRLAPTAIAANGRCVVVLEVQATADGLLAVTATAGSASLGSGGSDTYSVPVLALPVTTIDVSPSFPMGGSRTATVTLSSGPNNNYTGPAVGVSVALGSGLGTLGTFDGSTNCPFATIHSVSGGVIVTTSFNLPAPGTCHATFTVVGNSAGATSITAHLIAANGSGTSPNTTANVVVMPPLTVTETIAPTTVYPGEQATLTYGFANSGAAPATGVSFADTLPSGIGFGDLSSATNTCGGTLTPVAQSIQLTGGTVPAGGSCSLTVPIATREAGSYATNAVPVTSGNAGTVNSPQATLFVASPPVVSTQLRLSTLFTPTEGTLQVDLRSNFLASFIEACGAAIGRTCKITSSANTIFQPSTSAGINQTARPAIAFCGAAVSITPDGHTASMGSMVIPPGGSCSVSIPFIVTAPGPVYMTLQPSAFVTAGAGFGPSAAVVVSAAPGGYPNTGQPPTVPTGRYAWVLLLLLPTLGVLRFAARR